MKKKLKHPHSRNCGTLIKGQRADFEWCQRPRRSLHGFLHTCAGRQAVPSNEKEGGTVKRFPPELGSLQPGC